MIGSHMVKRLVSEGYWVRGVDVKSPEFSETAAHEFVPGDLTDRSFVKRCLEYKGPYNNFYHEIHWRYVGSFDEIYHFDVIDVFGVKKFYLQRQFCHKIYFY